MNNQRACLDHGSISHLLEPVYHGNPISSEGSLVAWDWGYEKDIIAYSRKDHDGTSRLLQKRSIH